MSTAPPSRRRLAPLLLLLAALAPAAARPLVVQEPAAPSPLPEVALDGVEPAVREQLESQRTALEEARSDDLEPRRLGAAYGELGQLYLLYDLSAAARVALDNAALLDAANPRWPYLLGTLHDLDGRTGEAVAAYRRVLALQSGGRDLPTEARLAAALLRAGDLDEAETLYDGLRGAGDFRAVALFGLGRVAAERGDHERAVERLSAALAAQPAANRIHYHLGLSQRQLGDLDRARFHLENSGEQEVTFPDPVVMSLQSEVRGVGALLSLGRISLATGEPEVAEERFLAAADIGPGNPSPQLSLGNLYRRQGRFREAIQRYRRAVELAPDDVGSRYLLARLLVDHASGAGTDGGPPEDAAELLEEAVTHLREALAISPDLLDARLDLADALTSLGRFDAADTVIGTALERHPERTDLLYLRARVLADRIARLAGTPGAPIESWGELGRSSLDRFDAAVEQSETVPDAEVRLDLGVLRLRLGDTGKGRSSLEALLADETATSGMRARAAFHLANESAQRNRTGEAVALYRRATELDPALGEATFNLATLLGREERYDEAVAAYRALLETDPDHQSGRFSLAMALILAGRHPEARQVLEEGLERFPSAPAYGHLLARLLVASPDDTVRDGEVGLDLAHRLFEALPTPDHGETVAMALAEIGRFDRAIEWQERILAELEAAGAPTDGARARLDGYRALRPVRSPWLDAGGARPEP